MKKPEDRLTPGRKRKYLEPVNVTVFIPGDLLERAAALEVEGAKSRNAKIVGLLRRGIALTEALMAVKEAEQESVSIEAEVL